MALVKELEEMLVAEESMDEEVEMREEKVHYNVKRGAVTVRQKVHVEEDEDGGKGKSESQGVKEEEEDEDEDEPMCSSGLSVKAKGKRPAN